MSATPCHTSQGCSQFRKERQSPSAHLWCSCTAQARTGPGAVNACVCLRGPCTGRVYIRGQRASVVRPVLIPSHSGTATHDSYHVGCTRRVGCAGRTRQTVHVSRVSGNCFAVHTHTHTHTRTHTHKVQPRAHVCTYMCTHARAYIRTHTRTDVHCAPSRCFYDVL